MGKRLTDILVAVVVLVLAAPLLVFAMFLIWVQDGGPPLYRGPRVGKGGRQFRMVKLRSMAVDAERRGGASTARSDARVTLLGRVLRRWKVDELPQFWNVLRGEMSVVGPRPNTWAGGVERYTAAELRLLYVRPGVTDLASIVFADEADILDGAADPDACYDTMIRPWKSRLALLYIERASAAVDWRIIALTALAIVARRAALERVDALLAGWSASDELRRICRRRSPPPHGPPPGQLA
jgi:lipopolysaccharide/colanic/teichoic acid biosynthesis glycosyltransferase